jgi:hypothetical protein
MRKFENNLRKTFAVFVVVLMLTAATVVTIVPTVSAKTTLSVGSNNLSFGYDPIGVNQPLRMSLQFNARILPYADGDPLPGAYVNLTRPDGTTITLTGPFNYSWSSGYGSSSYVKPWIYTPDQAGTWYAEFVWPGDANYNPYSVKKPFIVQKDPVTIQLQSNGYLSFRPNPVGLGQTLLINAWVTPRPRNLGETYSGMWITFTKPDGTTDKWGPFTTFPEGSFWFEYVPDKLGNWTVQLTWDGDIYATPVSTAKQPLTVQQEWITDYPAASLPTDEWTYQSTQKTGMVLNFWTLATRMGRYIGHLGTCTAKLLDPAT